jgi:hypothetical protein
MYYSNIPSLVVHQLTYCGSKGSKIRNTSVRTGFVRDCKLLIGTSDLREGSEAHNCGRLVKCCEQSAGNIALLVDRHKPD